MKPCTHSFFLRPALGQFVCTHCGLVLAVESGQGGVPFYKRLGAADGADKTRTRMRSVPQNFKLAYTCAFYDARKASGGLALPLEAPLPPLPTLSTPDALNRRLGRWDSDTKQTN